jgi:hypothetical protein
MPTRKETLVKTRLASVVFGLALLVLTVAPTFAATGYAIGG